MTRLAPFRFAALLALALGLAGCGVISTLVEGSKYAKAVEADLESATGVRPSVGFNWSNGRLLTVTVAYPRLYERKPLAALAEIVRRSVESHFRQKPEDIVLSFSLGSSGSGTTAAGRASEQQVDSGFIPVRHGGPGTASKVGAADLRLDGRLSGGAARCSAGTDTWRRPQAS